jgi:hypothetical protein
LGRREGSGVQTAALVLFLVLVLLGMIFSSPVEVSLDYGRGRLGLGVKALGGLVRRRLSLDRGEAVETGRRATATFGRIVAEGWHWRAVGLFLLKRIRLENLEVDVTMGLGRADLTACSVGRAWALGAWAAGVLDRLVAPGSVRPRLAVTPRFDKEDFTVNVRGRARVRVFHLLAAGWLAWRTRRGTGENA